MSAFLGLRRFELICVVFVLTWIWCDVMSSYQDCGSTMKGSKTLYLKS